MKRTPFYRRPGKVGKFSGLRERVIWMIQTRGRLKGYGNAINAQAAAAFIRAYMGVA